MDHKRSTMYAMADGKNKTDINADKYYVVDMRSDTLSTPTPEMRKAMFEAVVGDDVYGEDPTVNELERRSAELLGKEASLFVPSGTMANLIASGAAQIAGVQLSTINNFPDGTFCLDELKRKIGGFDNHEAKTTLVIVENTHNICGGKVIPFEWIESLVKVCKEHSLLLHMDGARVFNAAEVLQVPVARIVKDFDSICFCLSKGLSAPVGSVLAGSKSFITDARRLRKALGGGMRQAGILAAAGLVALDTVVPRLCVDHEKVQKIARAIYDMKSPHITVDIATVQTNILLIQILNKEITGKDLARRLAIVTEEEIKNQITDSRGRGIRLKVSARDWPFARIVVYQQITDLDIEMAIKKLCFVIMSMTDDCKNICNAVEAMK